MKCDAIVCYGNGESVIMPFKSIRAVEEELDEILACFEDVTEVVVCAKGQVVRRLYKA